VRPTVKAPVHRGFDRGGARCFSEFFEMDDGIATDHPSAA